jgi:hypothetical protein
MARIFRILVRSSPTGRKGCQMRITKQIRRIMRDSIRMYCAPITGAIKGIRAEFNRIDLEIKSNRRAEHQPK